MQGIKKTPGIKYYLSVNLRKGSSSDKKLSNTGTISQDILKDPVKVLYLFQCFQEAQDDELCKVLSKSFESGVIDISDHSLLPHQVVSLGFFLTRSHRKWKELKLSNCQIGDHGMSILHQYLCGDNLEINKINLAKNGLTKASSHLIGNIVSHICVCTILLNNNNTVLEIDNNGLTAQEAKIINHLEELYISNNKLGDHGAKLLSTGIANSIALRVLDISSNNIASGIIAIANALANSTSLEEPCMSYNKVGDHEAEVLAEKIIQGKTLRKLDISRNYIGPSGTTAIANVLTKSTSLEYLNVGDNSIGQSGVIAIAKAIANNNKLKTLSLCYDHSHEPIAFDDEIDKESAIEIIRSLYNNSITKLSIPIRLHKDDIYLVNEEVAMVNAHRKLIDKPVIDFHVRFIDLKTEYYDSNYPPAV